MWILKTSIYKNANSHQDCQICYDDSNRIEIFFKTIFLKKITFLAGKLKLTLLDSGKYKTSRVNIKPLALRKTTLRESVHLWTQNQYFKGGFNSSNITFWHITTSLMIFPQYIICWVREVHANILEVP